LQSLGTAGLLCFCDLVVERAVNMSALVCGAGPREDVPRQNEGRRKKEDGGGVEKLES